MKKKHMLVLLMLLTVVLGAPLTVGAEAPVVDLSQAGTREMPSRQGLEIDQEEPSQRVSPSHQSEPMDQRVLRLERQIANLNEMNFASKVEKMQQELQQLHGQIEVQSHDLTQLKEQVRNFYQDLDQRLTKNQPKIAAHAEKVELSPENSAPSEDTQPVTENNKKKELQTYETAFNLLNRKEYDKAINSFQSFLKSYPESTYTVNAHYWLGEIYYLKEKPELASKEFQIIVNAYPDNPKVADALLKIALIAMDAGNYSKAKQNLAKVQKQYPGSTAAKIAALRLKEIKQKK